MAEETQDFLNSPQQPLESEQDAPRTTNRPATGARQASPDEVFSQDFQGTATAGDFLGLDLEFIDATPVSELDLTQPPTIGSSAGGALDAGLSAPGIEDDLDQLPEQGIADEGELSDLPAEESFDGFADLESEAESAAPEAGGLRNKLLVGVGALVVLGAGAYILVPMLGSKPSVTVPTAGEVAKGPERPNPRPPKAKDPVPDTTPAPLVTQPVEAYGRDAGPTSSRLTHNSGAPATFSLGRSLGEVFGDASRTQVATPTTDPVDDATASVASTLGIGLPDESNAAFPDFSQGYEWVSEDMLDMIWRGTEIPVEAIFAPARTLMPRVGPVRLFMKSGEVFEGRVYAVGENLIWLDTGPGRVGLDGAAFDRYEHLAVEASTSVEPEMPLGNQVRVRVPGGFLDGRILRQEGGTTTVVTEDGGKVTIADADVQPLQTERAKVLKY